MTLNKPLTLEEYFHVINKQPSPSPNKHIEDEGVNMFFNKVKEYAENLKASWSTLYAWEHPKTEVSIKAEEEEYGESPDYYIFEMYTASWYDDETEKQVAAKRSLVIGDQVGDKDPSWTSVLDKILDEMSKHYGYDLKSQVYYAVEFPTNDIYPEKAGRMLNDSVLQQLLLAFPEVYERHPKWNQPKNVFE